MIDRFNLDETRNWPNDKIGIYAIKSKYDEKHYVGQTIGQNGFYTRFQQHLSLLRRNKHDNIYLQRSYNKHTEEEFEFLILEICDLETNLNMREHFWIGKLQSMFYQKGWNIDYVDEYGVKKQDYRPVDRSKEFEVISPTGELIKGKNINAFAKAHQLDGANLSKVIAGVRKSYKGWKSTRPIPAPIVIEYEVYNPQWEIVKITNPYSFALQNNLWPINFSDMIKGKRASCAGWRSVKYCDKFSSNRAAKATPNPIFRLCSPDYQIHVFSDFNQFCEKYGLDKRIKRSLKKYTVSKGWSLLESGIYSLVKTVTQEILYGRTYSELAQKCQISTEAIKSIYSGGENTEFVLGPNPIKLNEINEDF